MTHEALESARLELLFAQRSCGYCPRICESSDHLYIHIVLRHQQPVPVIMAEGQAGEFKLLDAQSDRIECGVIIS